MSCQATQKGKSTGNAASKLTKNQQSKAVSNKVRKRFKTSLYSPFKSSWDRIPDEAREDLFSRLTALIEVRGQSVEDDGKSTGKKLAKYKELFIFGMNGVTKAMERQTVSTVLLESKTPISMQKHIVEMSRVRDCVIISVPGLEEKLAPKLGVSSLSALGIKSENTAEDVIKFKKFAEQYSISLPPQDPSTLDHTTSSEQGDEDTEDVHEPTQDKPIDESNHDEKSVSMVVADYSHLYVYKSQTKDMRTEFSSFSGQNFLAFSQDSSDSSDCDINQERTNRQKPGQNTPNSSKKRKSVKLNVKGKQADGGYMPVNLGNVVPQENRKTKKRRK